MLHRIDAPGVAMAAIDQDGDKQLQEHLTAAFARLGSEFAEFRVLLDDVDRKAGQILDELRVQAAEHGSDRDLTLRMLTQFREDIAAISDRAPDGPQKAVAYWRGKPPYRGLAAFEQTDEPIFYGREMEVDRLLGRAAQRLDAGAITVVTGASGAGKSSLLRAGLLTARPRPPARIAGLRPVARCGDNPGRSPAGGACDPSQRPRGPRTEGSARVAGGQPG